MVKIVGEVGTKSASTFDITASTNMLSSARRYSALVKGVHRGETGGTLYDASHHGMNGIGIAFPQRLYGGETLGRPWAFI